MSSSVQRPPASAHLPQADKFWRDLQESGAARRQDPRVHAQVPVCMNPAKGASIELHSNDLSYHGMQVRCDKRTAATLRPHPVPRGARALPEFPVTLQLDLDGIALRITLHARIAHVSLLSDAEPANEVAVGLHFVRFEHDAQQALHRFINQHLQPAGWP